MNHSGTLPSTVSIIDRDVGILGMALTGWVGRGIAIFGMYLPLFYVCLRLALHKLKTVTALTLQITQTLVCPICPHEDTAHMNMQLKHYMAHIRDCHSYLPGFSITCGMYGCPRQFKTWSTFRTHVYERHGSDPSMSNQQPQKAPQSAVDPQTTASATDPNLDDEMRWTSADTEGKNYDHMCNCM